VIPHQAVVPNAHARFADGQFTDDDLRGRVETLGERTVQYANIEPDPDSFESEANVGAQ
jgi:hypothetical protein